MIILGDIHGHTNKAIELALANPNKLIVQIGDWGLFPKHYIPLPENLKFFRGNHCNPDLAKKHPNYLGDFGFNNNFFWVSGAASIDKSQRIEGVSWWRNEELSYKEFDDCIKMYESMRPQIVLTHDGPQEIIQKMFGISDSTATRQALQAMFEIWQPKLWVFGHHHVRKEMSFSKSKFVCLEEFGMMEI